MSDSILLDLDQLNLLRNASKPTYVILDLKSGIYDFKFLPNNFKEVHGTALSNVEVIIFAPDDEHNNVRQVSEIETKNYLKIQKIKDHLPEICYAHHPSINQFNDFLKIVMKLHSLNVPDHCCFIFPISELRSEKIGSKINIHYEMARNTLSTHRNKFYNQPDDYTLKMIIKKWFYGDDTCTSYCLKNPKINLDTISNGQVGFKGVLDHYLTINRKSDRKLDEPSRILKKSKAHIISNPELLMDLLRTNPLSSNSNRDIEIGWSTRDYWTAINEFNSTRPWALQNDVNFNEFTLILYQFLGRYAYDLFLSKIKITWGINKFTRYEIIKSMTLPFNIHLLATI